VIPVYTYDALQQAAVAVPLSLGTDSDQVYLVLYGTGIRGRGQLPDVEVEIGGSGVPVTYTGAQSEYPGFDQVNVGPLPRSLGGRGEVTVVMTVDGRRANQVTVSIQ
jgi:uncharacterized protein (TIGR03437 family)